MTIVQITTRLYVFNKNLAQNFLITFIFPNAPNLGNYLVTIQKILWSFGDEYYDVKEGFWAMFYIKYVTEFDELSNFIHSIFTLLDIGVCVHFAAPEP